MVSRYLRNISVEEIGEVGQEILSQSSILVVGAGGLGSSCLISLAQAGIGKITIYDGDKVDLTNLQRQTLYRDTDVGFNKSHIAKKRLSKINPDIEVNAFDEFFGEDIDQQKFDLVIDCTDNFKTRQIINKYSVDNSIKLVSASIIGFVGQIAVFLKPCYRCFCPLDSNDDLPDCVSDGVLGASVSIIGSMQALEAIKLLLNFSLLEGHIINYDLRDYKFKKLKLIQDPNCPVCS